MPSTSAATLSSSRTFQLTKVSMSGWSRSSTRIRAARRVVPPDLIDPAARSPTLRKLISPLLVPPPESFSPPPRMDETLTPRPRAVLEDAGLADPQVHNPAGVHQIIVHAQDVTRVGRGVGVRILRRAVLPPPEVGSEGSTRYCPCAGPVRP